MSSDKVNRVSDKVNVASRLREPSFIWGPPLLMLVYN